MQEKKPAASPAPVTRTAQDFKRRLEEGPLLADGAMGTELYRRANVAWEACLDNLNMTHPDLVRQVHLDYIEAGAEIIETNTFGANRIRLEPYGLGDSAGLINRRAVELAQEAQRLTGQRVWIAGDMGPLGKPLAPFGAIAKEEARALFEEQARALAEAGVDLFILETFTSLAEIQEAIAAVRAVAGLPIIAQMTFTQEGRTLADETPEDVMEALSGLDVVAVGANCSVGSDHMLQVIERMAASHKDCRVSAMPNAGFPTYVNGRAAYGSTPAYMADRAAHMLDAGAVIIGGCCGTTPEHISAMRDMLYEREEKDRTSAVRASPARPKGGKRETRAYPPAEPTALAKKLARKEFVVTVEVHPPRGFHVESTLDELRSLLRRVHVDAFNATDAPLAQGRMSALAISTLIQSRLGVEAILHMATRYRNLIALQSDLLGAHALGIRNVFVFMGDPPAMGDHPTAVSFSDVTSSGLIKLMKHANAGEDLAGRPIDEPTSFLVSCALNFEAPDMDKELQSLERKVAAGADFILSQNVFNAESIERCHTRLGGFPLPLVLGVLPLRSSRHAEFLHNEVPGMVVPEPLRTRLREAGADAGAVGVTIAQELITRVHPLIAGVYLVPSFGRYDVMADVIAGLPGRQTKTV